jgi:hypothetical protein
MAEFIIGKPVELDRPNVEVTVNTDAPLPVGRHKFQLIVEDDSANQSLPDEVEIIVRDTQRPTAVISAPAQVEFGQSFTISGKGSSDVAPGKVVKYIWTRLD